MYDKEDRSFSLFAGEQEMDQKTGYLKIFSKYVNDTQSWKKLITDNFLTKIYCIFTKLYINIYLINIDFTRIYKFS